MKQRKPREMDPAYREYIETPHRKTFKAAKQQNAMRSTKGIAKVSLAPVKFLEEDRI